MGLFQMARWITRRGFVVIGWHGVSMDDEHERIPAYFVSPTTLRRRLEHLQKLGRLEALDLTVTFITEAGARRLQEALPGCRIEW